MDGRTSEKIKQVYYEDPLNDEFSGFPAKGFFIPADYRYIHRNILYRFFTVIVYRLILTPLAFLYRVFGPHQTFVNRKVLKPFRKKGYFLYGNHTSHFGGGFTPTNVAFPKRVYLVVSPSNIAVKGLSTVIKMGGAMPIPSTLSGMPRFFDAIKVRYEQKSVICIYPEAHIWPYCTWIRPYKSVSFKFPVRLNAPVFAFTDCYKKRRFSKKPRTVTFVDGPFFPNMAIPEAQRHDDLRDRVYEAMKARASKESTYSFLDYVEKPKEATL